MTQSYFTIKAFNENGENIGAITSTGKVSNFSVESVSYSSLVDEWMSGHADVARVPKTFVIYEKRGFVDIAVNACVMYQRKFLNSGWVQDLRPMTLDDIAKVTGLDISTLSRLTREVYLFTENGAYTLDSNTVDLKTPSMFDEGAIRNGKEISRLEVLFKMSDILKEENSLNPFTDQDVTDILTHEGYNIARRTVAKYREAFLHIPKRSKRRIAINYKMCA